MKYRDVVRLIEEEAGFKFARKEVIGHTNTQLK